MDGSLGVRVVLFDYFGVLAHQYGQPDGRVMDVIQKYLAGKHRLAVLSNMSSGTAEEMLGQYAALFEEVMLSGELGVAKPDERAFRLAAQQLGEFPEACVMIDDSEINCTVAEQVGMRSVHFTGVDQLEQKLAEYGILTP